MPGNIQGCHQSVLKNLHGIIKYGQYYLTCILSRWRFLPTISHLSTAGDTHRWEIVLSRMSTYKLHSLLRPHFRQHFIFYSSVPSQVYCGFHGRATSQHWSIGKILKKFGRPFYKTTILPVLHHRLNMLFTGDAHSAHCKEAVHSQVRASFPQGLL